MPSGCLDRAKMNKAYSVLVRRYTPSGEYYFEPDWVEHKMSTLCRQTGVLLNGQWTELEDCVGCTAERDEVFINGQRAAYEAALQSSRLHGALRAGAYGGVRTE